MIELFVGQITKFKSGCSERGAFLMSVFSNLCSLVIANVVVECCDQHEGIFKVVRDVLLNWLHAFDAFGSERPA